MTKPLDLTPKIDAHTVLTDFYPNSPHCVTRKHLSQYPQGDASGLKNSRKDEH